MAGNTDLSTSIEGYQLYCLAEGKRPTTIRWYITKLHLFERYLQDQGLSTDVRDLTTTQMRGFLVHLRDNVKADENNPNKPTRDSPLSGSTLQGYARTLKAFCSWLAREAYVEDNPGRLLKIPKATRMIVQTFSDPQITKLLAVIDRKTPKGFRDYCMVLLLLDTGIRLSELANLQITDLDLERGLFKVLGKGARERLVPFGAKVQTTLWKYIHKFRPEPTHPNIGNLFLCSSGRPIGSNEIYQLVREYGHKAGLEGVRCTPHTFRHTFAKKFLTNGGDLFTLQKILGHSSLVVVRMYVELTPQDIQIQHRQYSPVDRIRL